MNYSSDNPSSEPTYTQLELPFDNLEPSEAIEPAESDEPSGPTYTQLEIPFGEVNPRLKYRAYVETTCWDSGEQIALDLDYIGIPQDDEASAQKILAQFLTAIPSISAYAGMTSTVVENVPSKFMVFVQDDSALLFIRLYGSIEWVLPNE